ncbi:hypothetical protein [Aureispira anguillae]|uniref:Uncharacterized protein n=1 Tax=Aureispira anguillae TaxID=2864201 RepID=A0A915YHM5_9BACT|nr:hypothetical protein [Aureispira anguillae]BDS13177.1 hypothetical protein AsAng_0039050 [Aureispira anguillae]
MKTFFLMMALSIAFSPSLVAQKKAKKAKKGAVKTVKYRRSSLHTLLIGTDDFPRKETVIKAYNEAPFPDKYNNHTISEKLFNPNDYTVTEADREAAGLKKDSKLGALAKGAVSTATAGIVDENAADMPIIIDKYLKDKKIANKLVAKWFNRQEDGSFDMDLIGERGQYNASEMEANIAKGSARGVTSLKDAGVELINNTFLVVTKLKFVSNEVVAAAIKEAALIAAGKIALPPARLAAEKAAEEAYKKGKEGYSVWTTAYLYQLKWNDEIEATFYNDLWMNSATVDPAKKAAFDNSDLFELEFIGEEKATSLVTFSLKEKRTEEQIVSLATVRNIDAVYAKLQKKYDVFKTKTPLATAQPTITALIGKKEGLVGGEQFEVLEQSIDKKTGLTVYKSKGKITVEKDKVWDNRHNAGEGGAETDLKATTFKGGKKYYPGILIRQIK